MRKRKKMVNLGGGGDQLIPRGLRHLERYLLVHVRTETAVRTRGKNGKFEGVISYVAGASPPGVTSSGPRQNRDCRAGVVEGTEKSGGWRERTKKKNFG